MQYSINPGPCTLMKTFGTFDGVQYVSVDEFHRLITSGKFKKQIEQIRKWDAEGKAKECAAAKKRLPYLVMQGVCKEHRKLDSLEQLTGYAPFDIDHITPAQADAIMALFPGLRWVKEAHRSSRGGIHLAAAMGVVDCSKEDGCYDKEYKRRYALIAAELAALTGVPVDGQCKDCVRGIFVSYDPDAFLRSDEEVKCFDYPEVQEQRPVEETPQPVVSAASSSDIPVLEQYGRQFLKRHMYLPDHRHQYWVDWGCYLKYKNVPKEQLDAYIEMMISLLAKDGLIKSDDPSLRDSSEVTKAVNWGYDHDTAKEEQEGDDENEEDLIRNLPCFPDEVYENLPELVYQCIGWVCAEDSEILHRRRDSLLMASLTELSVLSGDSRILYGGRYHSLNLAYVLLSPPGNGKSLISNTFKLVAKADYQQFSQSLENIEAYNRSLEVWEREQHESAKKHCEPDESKRPTGKVPPIKVISMSSSTSKNQLVKVLEATKNDGIILNSTELSTMISALGQDVGKYSDLLCKVTMNEPVDQYFKVDERPVRIENPKMSLCLSGIIDQFHKLVPTMDDGLFSRFLIMLVSPQTQWVSQRPRPDGFVAESHFEALGEKALDMWNYLRLSPTQVVFSDAQWDFHDRSWSDELSEILKEGGLDRMSLCTRQGLAHMRIAALLTVIRKWEKYVALGMGQDKSAEIDFQQKHKVMPCCDADFQVAFHIARVLLKHSLALSTTKLSPLQVGTQNMRSFEWIQRALSLLSEQFTPKEFLAQAKQCGRSQSQGYRALSQLNKMKIISMVSDTPRIWKKG